MKNLVKRLTRDLKDGFEMIRSYTRVKLPFLSGYSTWHQAFLIICNYYIFELRWRFWFMKVIEVIVDWVKKLSENAPLLFFRLLNHFRELLWRFWWTKYSRYCRKKVNWYNLNDYKVMLCLICLKLQIPLERFVEKKRQDSKWNLVWTFLKI